MGTIRGLCERDAEEVVFTLVREHAGELLRFARRFSLCADDAQDAYQRALEKLLRQLRNGAPPERTLPWLRTVLRHECAQVREERERAVSRFSLDDERDHGGGEDPADRAERFERLAQTAEALGRLKPQEVTALVLRAQGLSYAEICERMQWTYTRCNRCVTEGRRALRERLRQIESGAECERWLPLLSRLADGEASARDLAELRPHLRSCPGCRATLRSFHAAPQQIGALVPVAVLPAAVGAGAGADGALRPLEAVAHWLMERATVSAVRVQGAIEALPGAKVAAVAASTAAVAGGGVAIERAATADPVPPPAAAVVAAAPADGGAATWSESIAVRIGPHDGSDPAAGADDGTGPSAGGEWAQDEAPGEFSLAPPSDATAVAPPEWSTGRGRASTSSTTTPSAPAGASTAPPEPFDARPPPAPEPFAAAPSSRSSPGAASSSPPPRQPSASPAPPRAEPDIRPPSEFGGF